MTSIEAMFGEEYDPQQVKEDNNEQATVRRIFQRGKNNAGFEKLRISAYEEFGDPLVTFEYFHQHYPDFPITLSSSKLKDVHKLTVWQAMKQGLTRKGLAKQVYAEYVSRAEDLNLDTTETDFGLVFPILYETRFVMHNRDDTADTFAERPHPRLLFPNPRGQQHGVIVMEPLEQLLDALEEGWEADGEDT